MAERSEPISLSFSQQSLDNLEQFSQRLSDHRQVTELAFEDCTVQSSLWPEVRNVLSKGPCTVQKLKIIGTQLDSGAWSVVQDILKICKVQVFAVEVNEANCKDFLTSCKGVKLESLHFYVRGQEVGVILPNIRDLLNLKAQKKELLVVDVEKAHLNKLEKSGVRIKLPVDVIDVSNNTADDDNWRVVAALLLACDTEELIMQNCVCNVTTTRFHANPFPAQKLKRLDASYGYLDDLSWHVLLGLVYVCHVDELIIKNCPMSAQNRAVPVEELGIPKLQLLDMSDSLIDDVAWDRIVKILKSCDVQKVVLQNCDFKSSRPGFHITRKFTAIDISKNYLDHETCKLLGKMLRASEVQRLEMHECILEEDSLKALAQFEYKLELIDISQTDLSKSWEGLVELISATRDVSYRLTGCILPNEADIAVKKALMETNQKLASVEKKPFFQGVTVDSIKARIRDFLKPSWLHLDKLKIQLKKKEEDTSVATAAGPSQDIEPHDIMQRRLPMPPIKVKGIHAGTFKKIAPDPLQHSTILSKCRSQISDKGIVYLSHTTLTIQGVYQMTEAVKGSNVKMIVCSACSLDDGCVVELVNAATQSSGVLEVLDISFNPHLGEESAESIAELVHTKDVREIVLSGCGLELHFEKIIKPATLHAKFKAIKIKCADVAETNLSDDRKEEEVPVKSSDASEAREDRKGNGFPVETADVLEKDQKWDGILMETECEVSAMGREVPLYDCHIDFPAGAVKKPTRFHFSLDVGTDFWSGEYLRAAPTLICRPAAEFKVPVKIRLPVWCSTVSENVELIVVRQDGESQTLSTILKRSLKDLEGVIEFECGQFSRFWAFIRWVFFGELIYRVSVAVYFDRLGNFIVAFVPKDHSLDEYTEKNLAKRRFKLAPMVLDSMSIKTNDRIGIKLGCKEKDAVFEQEEPQHFDVDEKFAKELEKCIPFQAKDFPQGKVTLTIEIQCNGVVALQRECLFWLQDGKEDARTLHVENYIQNMENVQIQQGAGGQPV